MLATSMRSSVFAGHSVSSRSAIVCAPRNVFVIEAAHKKGAGSTKNGRDSESKRRGVKVYGGQPVKAGGIIFRQTGSTVSGLNGVLRGSRDKGVQPSNQLACRGSVHDTDAVLLI